MHKIFEEWFPIPIMDQATFDKARGVIDEVAARDIPAASKIAPKAFAMACIEEWSKQEWHCNICGGSVDLTAATKPTVHGGRGG